MISKTWNGAAHLPVRGGDDSCPRGGVGVLRGWQEGQGERPALCFLQVPPNRPQGKSSADTALLRDSPTRGGSSSWLPKV